MAVFEWNGKWAISSEPAPSDRMKACANTPKGAPRSLSKRLTHLRETILCLIWPKQLQELNNMGKDG